VIQRDFQKRWGSISVIEPLIVYAVLFFPDLASLGAAGGAVSGIETGKVIFFSSRREITRIVGYDFPALLLLWYLAFMRGRKLFPLKIRAGDVQSLAIALPGLLGIGLAVSVLAPLVYPSAEGFSVEAPRGVIPCLVMLLSCLSTGYLEETYFRHYLLSRFEETGANTILGIAISVALFSLSHFYEGFWGMINAVLAGLLLSLIYRRYGVLHGIAWAHGLYNAFIYATGI
jgi:membrane protease YdiL (CAAX protease family)